MKLSIMENATDSLARAIRAFAEGTPSGLKAAVKELVSCIELLVKEHLRRLDLNPADPVLLFSKLRVVPDPSVGAYRVKPLSRNSVTFEEALDRLAWLGAPLSMPEIAAIRKLKGIRNALEHLDVEEDPASVTKFFASALGFTGKLLEKHLGTALHSVVPPEEWRLVVSSDPVYTEVERSFRELYESISEAEAAYVGARVCVYCGTDLVIPTGGYYSGLACRLCGHKQDFEECYGCKETFPLDELVPYEGDTALCPACAKRMGG